MIYVCNGQLPAINRSAEAIALTYKNVLHFSAKRACKKHAAYKLYGEWCDKYGYRKENSTNFNNAIQRFFRIERKRPNGESGGPTTMLIGCRFLEHENGEAEEETGAFC